MFVCKHAGNVKFQNVYNTAGYMRHIMQEDINQS